MRTKKHRDWSDVTYKPVNASNLQMLEERELIKVETKLTEDTYDLHLHPFLGMTPVRGKNSAIAHLPTLPQASCHSWEWLCKNFSSNNSDAN